MSWGRLISMPLLRLLLLAVCLMATVANSGDRGPLIPKASGEQCVADTDFMRKNHMDLIIHQRDETVIKGIRDEPFSLTECVDCHVQRDANNEPIRIDEEGQFCASCHAFVAAKIDCFTCHAAVPAVGQGHEERVDNEHWLPSEQLLAWTLGTDPLTDAAKSERDDEASNIQNLK